MMKIIVIIILCAGRMLLGLFGWNPLDDRADKNVIFQQVKENRKLLMTCIENHLFDDLKQSLSIQKIDVREDHVDFYCGGAGFGPGTAYRGFFYTESDDLYAIWCAPARNQTLTAEGSGYIWDNGDDRYYVEKICDRFYYYDASF